MNPYALGIQNLFAQGCHGLHCMRDSCPKLGEGGKMGSVGKNWEPLQKTFRPQFSKLAFHIESLSFYIYQNTCDSMWKSHLKN